MEWASGGFDVTPQPQELQVLQLVAVEVAAHVDALAPVRLQELIGQRRH